MPPPGQTRTVALDITPDSRACYEVNMKCVVKPGKFEIMIGASSRDSGLRKPILLVQ
ncbi:MAG: fibronectin type III-like domain-contianing protein [Limisphaerales bacterium]